MSRAFPLRIPLFWLVIFSMFLMTGILGYYIYQSYESARNAIVKETSYLFVNTIQELESGRLEDIVRRWTSDSIRLNPSVLQSTSDSAHSVRIVKLMQDTDVYERENTSVDIHIEQEQHGPLIKEGVVSVFVQSSDSLLTDSLISGAHFLLSELQDDFESSLGDADLNIDYRIICTDSSTTNNNSFIVNPYGVSASGESYGIELKNLSSYALKKIIPEILLSLFVLLCTGLAFYTMYRQLIREKQLSEQKQDLIQNITHELKTPVTTVSLAIQAISDFAKENPQKQIEYVDISKRELNRLSLLIDRVLSMNQMDSSTSLFIPEQIHLNDFLESIAYTFKVQLQEKNGEINTEYSKGNIILQADRQQLAQVFYNLIDNAIKYNNSENIRININTEQTDSTIHISVEDNGIGISENHTDKIFDSFYRVPQGNMHNVKGYGLGLALVKKAITRLNGEVTINQSKLGGVQFVITIPRIS